MDEKPHCGTKEKESKCVWIIWLQTGNINPFRCNSWQLVYYRISMQRLMGPVLESLHQLYQK